MSTLTLTTGKPLPAEIPQRRRQRHPPDERRSQILSESVSFFAEQGFAGSTRDLARQIGVSQPLLFRYFKSKEELFDAVFDEVFTNRWDPAWTSLIGRRSLTLAERLTRFYQSYLKVAYSREWMRLYIFAGLADIGINRRYFEIVEQRVLRPLCVELRAEFNMPRAEEVPITNSELDYVWSFHGGVFYHGIRRCAFGTSIDHELGDDVLQMSIKALFDAAPHAIARFLKQ